MRVDKDVKDGTPILASVAVALKARAKTSILIAVLPSGKSIFYVFLFNQLYSFRFFHSSI